MTAQGRHLEMTPDGDRFKYEGQRLYSLHQINSLPTVIKEGLYRQLLPGQLLKAWDIDPESLRGPEGNCLVTFTCPDGSRMVEIDVRPEPGFRDPLLYLELRDTQLNQIEVLLFVVNDPRAERFETDRDWQGERTKFGTFARNIPAEVRALRAGLAPGQVRAGLRQTRVLVPLFEEFVRHLGHDYYLMEPLAYHSAILFERLGCNYVQGRRRMEWIDQGFQPGGPLHAALDGSTPFRQPDAWRTVRGRSWAIHDGILGEPWHGIRMYKQVGKYAGVDTFGGEGY
ncbi:MAG: hypothetical protein ACK2UY_02415 [Anaerolineae bacterium]